MKLAICEGMLRSAPNLYFMFRWVPLIFLLPPSYTRDFAPVSLDFMYFRSWIHYIWFQQSVSKILIQLLCTTLFPFFFWVHSRRGCPNKVRYSCNLCMLFYPFYPPIPTCLLLPVHSKLLNKRYTLLSLSSSLFK